jgi:hypothetical protein
MNCIAHIGCVLVAVGALLAQEKKNVPPPPKPTDDGPSLEVTMKFIQKQLNDQGKVNTIETQRDTLKNLETYHGKLVSETSNVSADFSTCRLSWHETSDTAKISVVEQTPELLLRDVSKLEVALFSDLLNRNRAKQGLSEVVSEYSPAIYGLAIYMSEGKKISGHVHVTMADGRSSEGLLAGSEQRMIFREEELANRVAKAMLHAVELCGGGRDTKAEPF